jgi:hypothetical protein
MDRSLWPVGVEMAGKTVSTPLETPSNSVAIDICDLVVSAFAGQGYDDQNAAAILGMSKATFSKSFRDANQEYPNNGAMKRLGQIPRDVLCAFSDALSAKLGRSVGIDNAKVQASVQVADAVLNLMRVAQR